MLAALLALPWVAGLLVCAYLVCLGLAHYHVR